MRIKLSESRGQKWRALWLATTSLVLSSASVARAQEAPPPPKYEAVDSNGVDLLSGSIAIPQRPVNSIGQGLGSLTATERVRYGDPLSSELSYVRLNREGEFADIFRTTVVLLGATETFEGTPATGAAPDSYTTGDVRVDGTDIVYTQKDGTVARFTKVTLGLTGPAMRIGYLKSVTYPTGDKITADIVYGGNMQLESSVGYAMTGSIYGNRWSPIAANLKDGSCSAGVCSGPSYVDQATLGRAMTSAVNGWTLTLTDPTGATSTYTLNSESRVTSYSNGAATWTYAYSEAVDAYGPQDSVLTVTATDPLGNRRVVTTRTSAQHILSDTVGIKPDGTGGRTTTFQYVADSVRSGFGMLKQITFPEGNRSRYEYDGYNNVTAKWDDAKPGSGLASTSITASYNTALCASLKICDKPDWVRDARGNQTDFTYDPAHGGVLTVTKPAGTNGVRPQTRYTYGQFTAMYVRGGVMQAAAAPVWRLTQTSTCAAGVAPACLGTADETVTTYTYEPSSAPNNVRLLSITTRAGDNSLSATTSYAYDARGDVISTDGPLPGTADTTRTFYDASRWKVGEIGPDPDGGGPLAYRARKTTYANDGQVTLVETGKTTSQADLSSFTAFQSVFTDYDAQRRAAKTSLVAGGATQTVTQYGYDAAGRQICSTVRMNPAAFGALPASACVQGAPGSDGPDRITYTDYDAAGRVTKITSGYGIAP